VRTRRIADRLKTEPVLWLRKIFTFIEENSMLSIRDPHPFDAAVAEAERCRVEAKTTVKENPEIYADLSQQPSGWCVVTQKGPLSRLYHNGYGEAKLREDLDRGHKVLLTVGLVAKPDSPLNANRHVASVRVADPGRLSDYKLQLVSAQAKLHAAQALIK
jgi:hypothetical protein